MRLAIESRPRSGLGLLPEQSKAIQRNLFGDGVVDVADARSGRDARAIRFLIQMRRGQRYTQAEHLELPRHVLAVAHELDLSCENGRFTAFMLGRLEHRLRALWIAEHDRLCGATERRTPNSGFGTDGAAVRTELRVQ